MMTRIAALAVVLVAATAATASPEVRHMEEGRRAVVPDEWVDIGPARAGHPIELTIALNVPADRVAAVEETLLAVSDPRSPRYGQHLSMLEANAMAAPLTEHVRAAARWLEDAGVDEGRVRSTSHGGMVAVDSDAEEAGRLLGSRFHHYRHAVTGRVITRLAPNRLYTLPAEAADAVAFVSPSVRFPRERTGPLIRPRPRDTTRPISPSGGIFGTPPWLRELYGVPNGTTTTTNVTQSVISLIQQYWSPTDIVDYHKILCGAACAAYGNETGITKQVGKNVPTQPGDEANLDTQLITSVVGAGAGTSEVWYAPETFEQWAMLMANSTVIPQVASGSYGESENGISSTYAHRVNLEFAKIGTRGTSILIAAGDSGVGGNCSSAGVFSPDFPASSPYVTTVGGAFGGTPGKFPTGETADSIGGGGFSNYFATPSWQQSAVSSYLSSGTTLPPAADFNSSGRGYPDIAAQSEGITIILDGIPLPFVGGTSCATPMSSAIVTLLNDLRAQAGKPALGFLNPMIYQNGGAFSDFVSGSQQGCGFSGGFKPASGWDPTSGFGSPNYERLAKAVKSFA